MELQEGASFLGSIILIRIFWAPQSDGWPFVLVQDLQIFFRGVRGSVLVTFVIEPQKYYKDSSKTCLSLGIWVLKPPETGKKTHNYGPIRKKN